MVLYSAGCGRSGTFCTIDTVLELLKKPDAFDYNETLILQIVETFRTQRMQTVQREVSSNGLQTYFSYVYTTSTVGSIKILL